MAKHAEVVREQPSIAAPGFAEKLDSWKKILAQGNLPEGRSIDEISRWLLITRAAVFSMTITSGLIGGLLAAASGAAPAWDASPSRCSGSCSRTPPTT